MSQYEVIALKCRETRSREHAAKTDDISVRIAHLKLADLYRDQITQLTAMQVEVERPIVHQVGEFE